MFNWKKRLLKTVIYTNKSTIRGQITTKVPYVKSLEVYLHIHIFCIQLQHWYSVKIHYTSELNLVPVDRSRPRERETDRQRESWVGLQLYKCKPNSDIRPKTYHNYVTCLVPQWNSSSPHFRVTQKFSSVSSLQSDRKLHTNVYGTCSISLAHVNSGGMCVRCDRHALPCL